MRYLIPRIEIWSPLDDASGAVQTIDYPHHEIHEGDHYTADRTDSDLDTSQTIEILIVTPDTTKWAHFTLSVTGTLATDVALYRGTSKTGGTAMTAHNNNHNSGNTSGLTITHTPGGSGDGTLVFEDIFGSPTPGPFGGSGGVVGERNERILKQNESYLLRVTSQADNNRVAVHLAWYEHTNLA